MELILHFTCICKCNAACNATKSFNVLTISLSILHNYFDSFDRSNKVIFVSVSTYIIVKFFNTLTELFLYTKVMIKRVHGHQILIVSSLLQSNKSRKSSEKMYMLHRADRRSRNREWTESELYSYSVSFRRLMRDYFHLPYFCFHELAFGGAARAVSSPSPRTFETKKMTHRDENDENVNKSHAHVRKW